MAFDLAPGPAVSSEHYKRVPLNVREKAALFDLAMQLSNSPDANVITPQTATVISAFAKAYILIRDREEGIV